MESHQVSASSGEALLIASVDAIGVTRLPRLLHNANLRVTLLGGARLAVGRSHFVHRHLRTADDPPAILSAVRRHLQTASTLYRLVLLADDPLFWAAAQQRNRLWMQSWFPVAVTSHAAVLRIASKIDFIDEAARRGLPIPRFRICATIDAAQAAAASLGYPALLKIAYGFSGSALRFVRNAQDLAEQARGFTQEQPFLVQEFINGEVGATPVLFDRGRPVWWFSYLMRDPWPNQFASASAIAMFDHTGVEPLLKEVGALTGFHGVGAIDWVRDPATDRLFLIEFNPRPTPALYLSAHAGAPFATALADWLSGAPHTHRPCPRRDAPRKLPLFPQHLHFSIDAHSAREFFTTWRDAPWQDPRLLLTQLRRVGTHYLPANWRRRGKTASVLDRQALIAK